MCHKNPRHPIWLSVVAIILMISSVAFRWSTAQNNPDTPVLLTIFAICLAALIPIGLALLAAGGWADHRAALSALMAVAALGIAGTGFLLTGFAFQFGGVGLVSSASGLQDLIWEWSLLDASWGLGWGMLGLRGFALGGEAANPDAYLLFLSQLVPLSIVVLLPLLALRNYVKPLILLFMVFLLSMFIYPAVGNWVWGGGWLANLGVNAGLGHGFVDFAGAGTIHLVATGVALAGLLVFAPRNDSPINQPAEMPPIHLPLLAILGGFITIPGWIGLSLSNPLLASADVAWSLIAINLVMAGVGGAMLALVYSWFTTGSANVFMTSRGLICGLVAISAVCPFVPAWLALLTGAFAGLMLPLMSYFVTHVIKLADQALIVPIHGVSAIWGLLVVGLFANGQYGAGWNGVGVASYLGISGQGVTGILVPPSVQPDFPQQLYAQLIGLAAILLFAFVVSWIGFRILSLFSLPGKVEQAEPTLNSETPELSVPADGTPHHQTRL